MSNIKSTKDDLTEAVYALIGMIIITFIIAWGVMILWNALVPVIFVSAGLGAITYWQSLGLCFLVRLLFGSNVK